MIFVAACIPGGAAAAFVEGPVSNEGFAEFLNAVVVAVRNIYIPCIVKRYINRPAKLAITAAVPPLFGNESTVCGEFLYPLITPFCYVNIICTVNHYAGRGIDLPIGGAVNSPFTQKGSG